MTDPRPLPDADLLAWAVVLEYRRQQQRDGITILQLPHPPCPTCGEAVHEATVWWVREPMKDQATIDLKPCGHAHTVSLADVDRIQPHLYEMLRSLESIDRTPGAVGSTTERIVAEARARTGQEAATDRPTLADLDAEPDGGTPWCCGGNAEDCPLCTDTPPYPWACPGHPDTAENRQRVQAATEAGEPAAWGQLEARAFNAVLPALREAGERLPLSACRAVARAVLAVVQPELDRGERLHQAHLEVERRLTWEAQTAQAAIARVRKATANSFMAGPNAVDVVRVADIHAALAEPKKRTAIQRSAGDQQGQP